MINKNTAGERIIFIFERLGEDQHFFRILFVEPITFQGQEAHYLAIPKTQSGENLSKKLQILQAGEKFEIIIAGDGTEAPAHFSGPSTSQKVRANKATNPTLAKQNLAPDNNWFASKLTQFMFAKEASSQVNKKDLEAAISFPILLSELTGFNDTLRGNPNHGYIKPLVRDLLQQLLQTNNPDLEKYLRIMEKYNGSLEGINLGAFDFPLARINWRIKYEREQTRQMSVEY
ncbi:16084_t:CDS:2 [Racocetra persica]|uniref:16084_t:CDS:1 n=1 Tax=Racocetra persica TaxID=160502 RepID=A0ACA9MJ33_9GLOM|nr:16084_t:CDS:2 [Racocetra persica]